jgi:hypothetical protein
MEGLCFVRVPFRFGVQRRERDVVSLVLAFLPHAVWREPRPVC